MSPLQFSDPCWGDQRVSQIDALQLRQPIQVVETYISDLPALDVQLSQPWEVPHVQQSLVRDTCFIQRQGSQLTQLLQMRQPRAFHSRAICPEDASETR